MWKLIIEDDQGHQTAVNLVRDEYSVGRAEENAVRLTERNISRHHAMLRRTGEEGAQRWLVEDLSSYNGCFVNGIRISGQQPLEHGDLLQLGDYRLEAQDEKLAGTASKRDNAATIPALPRAQSSSLPVRLVMLVGPTPGVEFALGDKPLLIGRGDECDIAVNHGSVSRVHAEIAPVDGRHEVVDKGSANGLRVNGVELGRALLDARDAIELGDVVLKYIPAGMAYQPGADESQQIAALPPDYNSIAPTSSSRTSSAVKLVAAIAVTAALVGVLVVVVTSSRGSPPPAATVDRTAAVLREAEALADRDIEAAHQRLLSGIPETSNARQSAAFRKLEARWADAMMARAEREPSLEKKRALLDRVARASTVDSGRRKEAARRLALLDEPGRDVATLPAEAAAVSSGVGDDGEDAAAAPAAAASGEPEAAPATADGPGEVAAATSARAPSGQQPPRPAPKPPTRQATSTKKRKSLQELMFSGDRRDQVQAKNILKGIVASGRASDYHKRMLKSLCRQVGDASCAN